MVAIYDKEDNTYLQDEDGIMEFKNVIAAKNYLFTLGYRYEFVNEKIDFHEKQEGFNTGRDA